MKRRGRKYTEKVSLIDRSVRFSPKAAIEAVRGVSYAKFDETFEVHFNLGIDPRHADQQLRGTLTLPNGTGKVNRVAVITSGEKVSDAENAGADAFGSEDLIEKIQGGWLEFDVLIASPDMMAKLGRLGRLLGSKGLMPNPKAGTVSNDISQAVKDFKAGKVEYRNDKNGLIHLPIGKASFSDDQLSENFNLVYDTLIRVKPSKARGTYMKSISFCTTMSPGVFVEPQQQKW